MSVKPKEKKSCSCREALLVTKKSASYMLSTFLLIIFFVFIAGYFWGHQTAVEEFSANIEQQSFADQIHYSLSCCVDDNQTLYSYDDSAEQELELEEQAPAVCPQQQITVQKPESSERYCAHLVGFQS